MLLLLRIRSINTVVMVVILIIRANEIAVEEEAVVNSGRGSIENGKRTNKIKTKLYNNSYDRGGGRKHVCSHLKSGMTTR